MMLVAYAVIFAFFSGTAWGGSGLPMTKVPVTPMTLSRALKTNDRSVLSCSANLFVEGWNALHPESAAASAKELSLIVETLELQDCALPADSLITSVGFTHDCKGLTRIFKRKPRANERGMCERNFGKPQISAYCGNTIDISKPVRRAETRMTRRPAQRQVAQMVPYEVGPPIEVDFESAYQSCPPGSHCGQLYETGRALIHAGGFAGGLIGAASVLRPARTNVENDSSSDSSSNSRAAGGAGGSSSAFGGNSTANGGRANLSDFSVNANGGKATANGGNVSDFSVGSDSDSYDTPW